MVVDRSNQTIHTEIVESKKRGGREEKSTEEEQGQQSNFTEIEVCLPIVNEDKVLDHLAKLKKFLIDYATVNTHIDFTFILPAADNDSSSHTNQQQQKQKHITLSFPQVQPINLKWTNINSIYYYTLPEFQNFIFGLENNDVLIYNIVKKIFREGSNMKKTDFAQITVGQLKQSPKHIDELYIQLRNTMRPISSPSNLSLPFDINKKVRIEAIKKRLEQRSPSFKVSDIKYKSKYGYCQLDGGVEFPFFFEIAVVSSNSIIYNLEYTESLNCSVMPGSYFFMIGADKETFRWQTQSDKKNNNNIRTSRSLFDVFEHYGYSYKKDKCKKPRSLIIVNLISPRIDYKSYGKSSIDLTPFADVIAETTVKACSGGSGGGLSRGILFSINGTEEPVSVIGLLRRLLEERLVAVQQDPTLKEKQKWTQSTVFYHLRPIPLANGYSNEDVDRQYITSEIKNVCEDYLGVKREELGITAADRAQLYFKGRSHDVGLQEINELIQYGTDMLIIEKEGVVEQLASFADEKGIALLNTRGFLTEYASILSEQASKNGCNIAILTDLDASGLLIASKISDVYRIGIDFDTLNYFDLDTSQVEEEYKSKENHLKPLQDLTDDLFSDLSSDVVEYVSEKRIEIDSVMATVNDNAKFWKFILDKLEEKFPTRNYNRAIPIPEYIMPEPLRALNEKVRKQSIPILEKERIKMKEQLSNTKGFLDVKQYDSSVSSDFRRKIEDDDSMKLLLEKIDNLVKGNFT
jgi:hypothetical protein